MKVLGVIPCRYGATRFPGKPLADIHGKPMMWHVYQRAIEAGCLDDVYIATDDNRIWDACKGLGLNVLMTSNDHLTGTDRVAECTRQIPADIYVNIQGDEPLIEPSAIRAVCDTIVECEDQSVMASNAFTVFEHASDVIDTNNVKVTVGVDGNAISYSRSPVPYPKGAEVRYLRQLGLYAFKREGLDIFAATKAGPVEMAEGVEMLRYLEHGHRVAMVEVVDNSIPVDTEIDLARVRSVFEKEHN